MTWKIFCAALLPLRLADLHARLPQLLDHLQKYRPKKRRTSLERWADEWVDVASESPS